MAKEKATITVDRAKVEEARALTGDRTVSGVIDVALTRLIAAERTRRDIAAYTRSPSSAAERALADMPVPDAGLADDTDWAALYDEES